MTAVDDGERERSGRRQGRREGGSRQGEGQHIHPPSLMRRSLVIEFVVLVGVEESLGRGRGG